MRMENGDKRISSHIYKCPMVLADLMDELQRTDTPPTSFTVAPAIYEAAIVTLTWSGTIPETSAIKQYVIQRSTSTDGVNWSAYEALTIVVLSATSGTYTANASQIAGMYTRYRISVTDTLDAVSAYVVNGAVKKNSPPSAPAIDCPVSGSSSYNTAPRFMITTGIKPDGQTQIVEAKIDTGPWINSVDNSEMFSVFCDARTVLESTIYEDKFTVEFKSGLTVDVNE